jgi:predicted O-linked N-acetylglucosamine transferase (SPINDLY family)
MPQLTIQQAFDLALQHHRTGRLPEAEQIYRQILARQPGHADSIHHLGVIAHQLGRSDDALECIRRAIAINPRLAEAHCNLGNILNQTEQFEDAAAAYSQAISLRPVFPEAQNNLGNVLRRIGRLDEAMAVYRQAIRLQPDHADAHSNLGAVLEMKGQLSEAIASHRTAIAMRPSFAGAYNNLGGALLATGQIEEGIAAYRTAIALKPDYAEALCNLGHALCESGRFTEAIDACQTAIALNPRLPDGHNNLGNALAAAERTGEAIAAYQTALRLRPDDAKTHYNLGCALAASSQIDEAISAFRHAIALRPDFAEAYSNLGNALCQNGMLEEAISACRRAIALQPDFAEAYSNLGNALAGKGEPDDAAAACRHAIALSPALAEAHCNLGNALKDAGRIGEAIAAYRQSIALEPDDSGARENLLYTLHFHPAYDARAIAEEHRLWALRHAEPLRQFIQPHFNVRDPSRRLRIGYVSGDFREHVIGRNILPIFRRHDRAQFHLTCYAQVKRPDRITAEFQQLADNWRNIAGVSDAQVAGKIRADQIDILVDLTMHMAGNRLLVFAQKPAPVQLTWAAYPASTGLSIMDYRLSDPYLDPFDGAQGDPPGMDESIYSEKTIRLPNSFWCYDPLEERELAVNPLPALSSTLRLSSSLSLRAEGRPEGSEPNGLVTFGCLNNLCKINEPVLALWSRVLRRVERSRLLILSPPGSHRHEMLERMSREGISPERVEFFPVQPRRAYMELYHRIDIGLDTFPYNGHTTSLDSLWMGVPVVTLVGQTAVARAGWCQLSNLGLIELAAHTPEQYVQIAVELAGDLPRLAEMRSTLRRRMEQSPLMDAPAFARDIEAAYRRMWRTWCESGSDGLQAITNAQQ